MELFLSAGIYSIFFSLHIEIIAGAYLFVVIAFFRIQPAVIDTLWDLIVPTRGNSAKDYFREVSTG